VKLPRVRILDFDCECRPLSWYGGDWVTKEITAIGWKFIGERYSIRTSLLVLEPVRDYYDLTNLRRVVEPFVEAYNAADIVTGHFIRGFDLPLINGTLMELGLPLLEDKLTQDTKLDLRKASGLSKSQENLGAMFELKHPKIPMDQAKWRSANRLTPAGIALTHRRVVGDVRQHIELRQRMLDLGLLGPPKAWSSGAGNKARYTP
jgi:hypothetical protein